MEAKRISFSKKQYFEEVSENKSLIMKPNQEFSPRALFTRAKGEPSGDMIIDQVVALLQENPALWGKDIANALGVSRRDLSGAMKILTGMGINAFVNEWHMLKAIELLHDPHLDFAEIAHRCGYRQRKYLARVLDHEFGFTPFEYRNGYRRGVERPK